MRIERRKREGLFNAIFGGKEGLVYGNACRKFAADSKQSGIPAVFVASDADKLIGGGVVSLPQAEAEDWLYEGFLVVRGYKKALEQDEPTCADSDVPGYLSNVPWLRPNIGRQIVIAAELVGQFTDELVKEFDAKHLDPKFAAK